MNSQNPVFGLAKIDNLFGTFLQSKCHTAPDTQKFTSKHSLEKQLTWKFLVEWWSKITSIKKRRSCQQHVQQTTRGVSCFGCPWCPCPFFYHRSHVFLNGPTFKDKRQHRSQIMCTMRQVIPPHKGVKMISNFRCFMTLCFVSRLKNVYLQNKNISIHTDSDIKLRIDHNWSYRKNKRWIQFSHCTNGTWKGSPNGINHWRPPLPQFGKGMPFMESPKLTNLPLKMGNIPKGTGLDPSKPSISLCF